MLRKDAMNNTITRMSAWLMILMIILVSSLISCNSGRIKYIPHYFNDTNIQSEIQESYDCTVQIFIITVDGDEGWGSGVVVSEDGIILTAKHVIDDAALIQVKSSNGIYKPAVVSYIDDREDFAFIKVKSNCDYETFGDFKSVELGDWVYIIGTPLDSELFNTVIYGTVSGLERRISFFSELPLLQLDAGIAGGFSGGAVFNIDGEIIGIINGMYTGTSITIATPITNIVKEFYATCQD